MLIYGNCMLLEPNLISFNIACVWNNLRLEATIALKVNIVAIPPLDLNHITPATRTVFYVFGTLTTSLFFRRPPLHLPLLPRSLPLPLPLPPPLLPLPHRRQLFMRNQLSQRSAFFVLQKKRLIC